MIKIGYIRNLALIGFSLVGEIEERVLIYDVFDMDFSTTFCMTESVEEFKRQQKDDKNNLDFNKCEGLIKSSFKFN